MLVPIIDFLRLERALNLVPPDDAAAGPAMEYHSATNEV
jgi:hypothetical protein